MQLSAVGALFDEKTTIDAKLLMDDYLQYGREVRGFSPATLKGRRIYLRQFYAYLTACDNTDITQLTNIDLDRYFVYMSTRVGTHSVNSAKRSIKGFLTWCSLYLDLPLRIKLQEIRERRPEDKYPKILTHSEITGVIQKVKNKQDKLIISVMYEAGLRIAEATNLKIEHLRGRTIDVVGKGKRHRITYITPSLAAQLQDWMRYNRWTEGHIFRPLMHGKGGGYEDTDTVRLRIKRHFRDVLGKDMHPHQLRHAFALRLLEQGCDLRSIQKMLGHAKIETTMVYLQVSDSHLEQQYMQSFKHSVYG